MNLGVLGAGNIGGTLGKKWAACGHQVCFGVRSPDKPSLVEQVKAMDGDVRIGTSSEAIAGADIIVLALPGAAVEQVVADNVSVLEGKTIIDASNNM